MCIIVIKLFKILLVYKTWSNAYILWRDYI